MKSAAIDFDGVLHDKIDGGGFGKRMFGAIDAIARFREKGFKVIIFTARPDLNAVKNWLKMQGFPDLEVTNRKPGADVYVDDRGFRFYSWSENEVDSAMRQADSFRTKANQKLKGFIDDSPCNVTASSR